MMSIAFGAGLGLRVLTDRDVLVVYNAFGSDMAAWLTTYLLVGV